MRVQLACFPRDIPRTRESPSGPRPCTPRPSHIIGADEMQREVWVSYPVPVPPLNPWHGYVLPASCPYKNGSLAIPHFSAGGLDFLMEDFAKSFIRRLGGSSVAGAGAALLTGAQNAAAVAVTMGDAKDCVLELKYFRLSHTLRSKRATDSTSGRRKHLTVPSHEPPWRPGTSQQDMSTMHT